MIWMNDGRIRVYVLGEMVETDGIWNVESCNSLKAPKLTFNVQKGHGGTIW